MALSSLVVSGLAPNLNVLGDTQNFIFAQNNTFWGIQNLFVPTLTVPSIANWQFKNNIFNGFRWSHVTDSTGGVGKLKMSFFLNDSPTGTDILSFTTTQTIFNLPAAFPYPVNPTDATTKQYVDERIPSGAISSLTGFVNGINPVSGIMTTTRGSTCLLMNIPAGGNVDMGNFKLINVATPTNNNDASNKVYVDAHTWLTSQITNFDTTVRTYHLSDFLIPLSDLSLNNFKITLLANPALSTDAANKGYVDTRTWTTSQITDFVSAVLAFRLDQFTAPTSSLNLNSQKIIALATPVASTDGVNKGYVDNTVVTLIGDVTASGALNTSISVLITKPINLLPLATGSLNLNSQKIINLLAPVLGTDGTNKTYVDTSPVTLIGSVSGTGALSSSITTTLNTRLDQVPLPTASVSLNSQKITNLSTPVASTDAANRGFVDNSTVSLTGDVNASGALSTSISVAITAPLNQLPLPTGPVYFGANQLRNLGAPTSGTDAANQNFVQAQANIAGTSGQIAVTGANPKVISLINTAVTPGTYTGFSQLIVEATGRITGITNLTTYQNLTFATALTWNWDSGNIANITLTGNTTLTIVPGSRQNGTLIAKQDATGNRKITLVTGTYNPGSTNPDAGLSGPGGKVDKLFFSIDINGAIYYDSISKDMRQVT